jgi:hypothetical protein
MSNTPDDDLSVELAAACARADQWVAEHVTGEHRAAIAAARVELTNLAGSFAAAIERHAPVLGSVPLVKGMHELDDLIRDRAWTVLGIDKMHATQFRIESATHAAVMDSADDALEALS